MKGLLKGTWFVAGICLLAAGMGAGIIAIVRLRSAARAEWAALRLATTERDRLLAEHPTPTEANADAIVAAISAAESQLVAIRSRWTVSGDSTPGRPVDAFFAIAMMTEQLRGLAARSGVGIARDEHFGFASYAAEGPPVGLLEPVARQAWAVRRLLEQLFAARPRELLAVQRDQPAPTGLGPPAAASSGRGGPMGRLGPDYFVPDARLVVRLPSVIDVSMFRLVFVGKTAALRAFLNSLATSPALLLVRSVEVQPADTNPGASPAGIREASGPAFSAGDSRFTVVVELAVPAHPKYPRRHEEAPAK